MAVLFYSRGQNEYLHVIEHVFSAFISSVLTVC